MNKNIGLALLAIVGLAFASCSGYPSKGKTNYSAPTVSRVTGQVTTAQSKLTSAAIHSVAIKTNVQAANLKAKTATDKVVLLEKGTEKTPELHDIAVSLHSDLDALTQELLSTSQENDQLSADLLNAQNALRSAQTNASVLQKQVGDQTNLLNQANEARNAAITQGQIDHKNAHTFKLILIVLAVAATAFLIFAIFGATCLAPPLLYATLGAPTAVGTFLFFYLGSA